MVLILNFEILTGFMKLTKISYEKMGSQKLPIWKPCSIVRFLFPLAISRLISCYRDKLKWKCFYNFFLIIWLFLQAFLKNKWQKYLSLRNVLTLIMLVFLKALFCWGKGSIRLPPPLYSRRANPIIIPLFNLFKES